MFAAWNHKIEILIRLEIHDRLFREMGDIHHNHDMMNNATGYSYGIKNIKVLRDYRI
jgi:hypothetical protein